MATLAGKTAVIVGASGEDNIGVAIARKLAAEGANVVVSARREAPLEALAADIGGLAIACDVTDEEQVEALFSRASEATGGVDIAVYSAGVYSSVLISELTADDVRPTLEVSFIGALLFFKHAAAAMPEGGSVITVSSLTARLPGPTLSVYSGARAGIDYAIKVAAQEYQGQKVRFNSIAAGLIETDMTGPLFEIEPIIAAHVAETPAGRMGTLNDMAEAALFLADEARSGFINGQVLDLAGGQQMGHLPRF
ncbi:SDR family oxidoreductase [Halioglobus maricola]|uniref:SDR family oxidoreductase n=1 Tax=Halioglobus maricola TaxID=2601894 RepID=A0A5P9NH90_9GAMM|nr:SDR family oxidoreductase [Halioglobus maricola]QFU75152.1 SDR family oxidoreductase [Halioglobus maricola]